MVEKKSINLANQKCINTNKTLLMYELRKQVETKQKKNLIEREN